MELTKKIHSKLEKILSRLKVLEVIESFKLEIKFCQVEESLKTTLYDIDSILKKCLKKILTKPRKAEIRNVINELVRKKNLSHTPVFPENQSRFSSNIESFEIPDLEFYEFKCAESEDLLVHKKAHKSKKTYLCDKCGVCFDNFLWWKNHFQEHIVNLKTDTILFDSQHQVVDVSNERNLKDTIQSNKNSINEVKVTENVNTPDNPLVSTTEKKFICECGKEFRLLKTLKKHESIKHSATNVIFNCAICRRSFKEKGKMNRHMLSHGKSQYKCCYCLKWFTRSDSLKRHLSLAHQPQKYFSCSFCQKKFNLKYNKDVHEENIHRKINNWIQCDQCGKKFKNKITFNVHLKIHSEKRFICKICGKSFARKIQLANHLKNSHVQSFSHTFSKERPVS